MGVTPVSQGSHQTIASLLRSLAHGYKWFALICFTTDADAAKTRTRDHINAGGDDARERRGLSEPLLKHGEEALCFRADFFYQVFTTLRFFFHQ